MDSEFKGLIENLAEVGNCSYNIALMKAKDLIGDFIEDQKKLNSTYISETDEIKDTSRTINIFYELNYGIFTIKTNNLGFPRTKINQLEVKLKNEIDKFLG
jgi:hypothetical protein